MWRQRQRPKCCACKPRNSRNCRQPWEAWFSLRASRSRQPCQHLHFTPPASRALRDIFLSYQVCGYIMAAIWYYTVMYFRKKIPFKRYYHWHNFSLTIIHFILRISERGGRLAGSVSRVCHSWSWIRAPRWV